MAEGGEDYNIETTDAGASTTIPMEAGQIKKGGYVCISSILCMVVYMGFWSMYVLRDFFCVCVEKMPMRYFYISFDTQC